MKEKVYVEHLTLNMTQFSNDLTSVHYFLLSSNEMISTKTTYKFQSFQERENIFHRDNWVDWKKYWTWSHCSHPTSNTK